MILWAEGDFRTPETTRVAWNDRGLLLGHGVFATMRGYRGTCFRAREHVETLALGARVLGIPVPRSVDAIVATADEAARRTGSDDAYVRVTLTAGPADGPSTLLIQASDFDDVPTDAMYAKGVATAILDARRSGPTCIDPRIKTTSYATEVVARREARTRGLFEGLQRSVVDGTLACGTMSNLFVVKGGVVKTPALASGCRNGLTRRTLMELARDEGLAVDEGTITDADLEGADEIFLASTRIEALPVGAVDGRAVPLGPVAPKLRRALRRLAGV